ncbi:hypothetical protein CTI12_AA156920 [Artemisia annua]|uniref:Uncharacterized protein n=1 Tax=Artemisia annua TaxID=35608 RepID=A0A2U1PFQ8_ARTAN|nr:hypothetical protein CTI12_AA156920 [Artemisia annua]
MHIHDLRKFALLWLHKTEEIYIECGRTLNEALRLHHEKRRCGDPNSLASPDLEKVNDQFEEIDHVKSNVTTETVQDSSLLEESSQTFLHIRFWMIFLWVSLVVGFGIVMMLILKGRKGQKKRGKGFKTRRRSSHKGFWEVNELHRTPLQA